MKTIEIVICLVISAGIYLISFLQFRQKGILLNNAYLYATAEERNRMNKKPYYFQSGIVLSLLGTIFLLYAIQTATEQAWISYLAALTVIVLIIYAIVSTIQIAKIK